MYTTLAMYVIWNNHFHVPSCSNAFSLFVLLKCNCECCVIIYKVLVDLWKVVGVVISTLNDGGIVNLEGYGWDLGSNLQSWIQSEFWLFWFKCVNFGFENYEFWRCILNKNHSFLSDNLRAWMQHVYDIGWRCNKFNILCVAHNCQVSMKNRQFGIIDQDMNATCENLRIVRLLYYVFTQVPS
jgi:hypothetical protein